VSISADRDIVRRLASRLAAFAVQPQQREKLEAWKSLNALRPQRPMLWITEVPWGEFENQVEALRLQSETEPCRSIERELRHRLFTACSLTCDEVVDGIWWLPLQINGANFGVEIHEQQILQGDSYIQSHHYEPVMKDFDDIAKIRMPDVSYDEAATLARKSFLEELFGGILPVRLHGPRQHFFPAWDDVVRWTGVTEALTDLLARPEFLHALMRRLTDSFLERMTQLEERHLLGEPHPLNRVGSGAAGFTDELPQPGSDPAHLRTIDQWGGATAQIFGEVSPAMHAEFALKYEMEVMARCGLNYYGCCEPLHNKMHLMDSVPRLRKISISAWCDVEKAASRAKRRYVFSHKPTPACFAEDQFDAARAEQELRQRLERSGNMPCEIIMKDISTVRGDVRRLIDWCQMAHRLVRNLPAR